MNPAKSVKAASRCLPVAAQVAILSGRAAPTIAKDPGDASTSAMTTEEHEQSAALFCGAGLHWPETRRRSIARWGTRR